MRRLQIVHNPVDLRLVVSDTPISSPTWIIDASLNACVLMLTESFVAVFVAVSVLICIDIVCSILWYLPSSLLARSFEAESVF